LVKNIIAVIIIVSGHFRSLHTQYNLHIVMATKNKTAETKVNVKDFVNSYVELNLFYLNLVH